MSVLALAGAPASTSFTCSPVTLPGPSWGLSWPEYDTIAVYGPMGCAALDYAGASTSERRSIARLNPRRIMARVVGYGLIVDEHEAMHIGLDSRNECVVEREALRVLPALLARYFAPAFAQQAYWYAQGYDSRLPASYHGC